MRVVIHVCVARGGQRGHGPPKILGYLVVLCFERRCPKPNTVARFKSQNIWPLPTFRAGYVTGHPQTLEHNSLVVPDLFFVPREEKVPGQLSVGTTSLFVCFPKIRIVDNAQRSAIACIFAVVVPVEHRRSLRRNDKVCNVWLGLKPETLDKKDCLSFSEKEIKVLCDKEKFRAGDHGPETTGRCRRSFCFPFCQTLNDHPVCVCFFGAAVGLSYNDSKLGRRRRP